MCCSHPILETTLETPDLPPDPTPNRPRKKANRPRQKATTRQQAEDQLTRYDRLLDVWLGKLNVASKKIDMYRKKVAHYRKRVVDLTATELATMEAAVKAAEQACGRQLRVIDLKGTEP